MSTIRTSLHAIALTFALAGCGDDAETGGSGGAGGTTTTTGNGAPTTTSSSSDAGSAGNDGSGGTGGTEAGDGGAGGSDVGAELVAACAANCARRGEVAAELGCNEVAEPCSCGEEDLSECAAQAVDLFDCLTEGSSSETCECDEAGDLLCNPSCGPELLQLDICLSPIPEDCDAIDEAASELACEGGDLSATCRDRAIEAADYGCTYQHVDYAECVAAAIATGCTCPDDAGPAECGELCADELGELDGCIGEF